MLSTETTAALEVYHLYKNMTLKSHIVEVNETVNYMLGM